MYLTYNYSVSCKVYSSDPSSRCIQLPPLWHSFVEKQIHLMPTFVFSKIPRMGEDIISPRFSIYRKLLDIFYKATSGVGFPDSLQYHY